MKKFIALAFLATLMAGCGTTGATKHAEQKAVSNDGFDMKQGNITLHMKGEELVGITSIATAQVLSDTGAGKEAAVTTATLRAKRNIVEFIENGMKSQEVLTQIATATHSDNTYSQTVAENIASQARQMLRGAYVSNQEMADGVASVTVDVTRQSTNAAFQLRSMMDGTQGEK
ncbi:MAG TPA: hypothetical protein VFM18_16665 [Methanosarcina sp.]|nr:hypothetical protein [Methanosarcina sp.]